MNNKIQNPKFKIQTNFKFQIFLVFLFFLVIRLFPYINNSVPTGYDAGLYLLNFKTFPNIPDWVRLGFAPGLYAAVYLMIKLGVSPESTLIPLSIFSQIFLFFSLYFVVKKLFGEKTALATSFIFTVSAIQFRTFWYFYVNNTFGLAFLLLSIYFFTKKSLFPACLLAILTGLFHLPTFLILFLIIVVETVFNTHDRWFYLKSLFLILAVSGLYYLPVFRQTLQPFFRPLWRSTLAVRLATKTLAPSYGGAFYSLKISFLLVAFYLPLALFGLIKKKANKRLFIIGLIITALIVLTKFSFYQRFMIPLDIFLILLAGIGLKDLDFLKFYLFLLLIFIIGFIIKTSSPLINKSLLTEIKIFGKNHQQGFILATAREDPSWLMGYTDLSVISQGFGSEDRYWKNDQWQKFYSSSSGERKIELLKKLPQPLYIFINDRYLGTFDWIKDRLCFAPQTLHFYQFICRD
ncbi:hypothetical protein COY89_02580 [Candidatus Roizmanbacteria bacterium CG_4_10_14_0_8_um_filter_36_36]|uniref:Glycosyltransferase RgtA/B/C/D-like domain-containing protein n=1 Tax=Candidatus Roizmanbacteria bacterium CG10_big_fil_rev_8_21_14_0_10_36_26 TaxID=1974851 RepID=A0A2M8KLB7_9BACT|nr:MAG: hypothetical protein COY89_02580 [Candidatus Roizmanbacteria bacterium CG_4_10_14_0_8_um_filter_36_36]PJE60713.1 MAG: hypothetical protein COU86_02800 [Candidatus Roizmanbacteria bacterium CG10_big_fil_rev_8_21_14_0_10_36_26]